MIRNRIHISAPHYKEISKYIRCHHWWNWQEQLLGGSYRKTFRKAKNDDDDDDDDDNDDNNNNDDYDDENNNNMQKKLEETIKETSRLWDRNGSTSGPAPCYLDDDDYYYITIIIIKSHTRSFWILFRISLVRISTWTQYLRNFNQFLLANIKYFLLNSSRCSYVVNLFLNVGNTVSFGHGEVGLWSVWITRILHYFLRVYILCLYKVTESCFVTKCSDPINLIVLLLKRINILIWVIACNHAIVGSSIDS